MTSDPRQTFSDDQSAAMTEAATRDQQGWEASLRGVQAHNARVEAGTALVRALAGLISLLIIAGALALIVVPLALVLS